MEAEFKACAAMPGIEWAMKGEPLMPPANTQQLTWLLVRAECNKRAYQEVAEIFPGVDLEGLLVIPTFQRSRNDLVQMGEKVSKAHSLARLLVD